MYFTPNILQIKENNARFIVGRSRPSRGDRPHPTGASIHKRNWWHTSTTALRWILGILASWTTPLSIFCVF